MTAYLSLMMAVLPDVAREGLMVMDRFNNGQAAPAEIESMRVRCWEVLDARSAAVEFTEPDNCAIRAAICFLYADAPADDMSELVGWFLSLANKVQDHSAEVELIMNKCF